jgi:hypothetical protein
MTWQYINREGTAIRWMQLSYARIGVVRLLDGLLGPNLMPQAITYRCRRL